MLHIAREDLSIYSILLHVKIFIRILLTCCGGLKDNMFLHAMYREW